MRPHFSSENRNEQKKKISERKEPTKIMYTVIELIEIGGYFLIGTFGTIMNIDMMLLLYNKYTRSVGSVFLANFALSNLLFALSIPVSLVVAINRQVFTLSNVVCKLSSFLTEMSLNCSTFFLTVIVFDQYASVVHTWVSFKLRSTHSALVMSLLIWTGSVLLSISAFVNRNIYPQNHFYHQKPPLPETVCTLTPHIGSQWHADTSCRCLWTMTWGGQIDHHHY